MCERSKPLHQRCISNSLCTAARLSLKEEDDSTDLSLRSGKSITGIQQWVMKKEYVQLGSTSAAYRNRECPTPTNTVNSGSARLDCCLRRQEKSELLQRLCDTNLQCSAVNGLIFEVIFEVE